MDVGTPIREIEVLPNAIPIPKPEEERDPAPAEPVKTPKREPVPA